MRSVRTSRRKPSARSLREIPELDFRAVTVKPNTYARRIATGGLVVQAGRAGPKRLLVGRRNPPHSVRVTDEIWRLLEHRARAKGLTLQAALRQAILEWARRAEVPVT
jgi:hypothetical protein